MHDMDKSENRADNTDSGRKTAGCLKYLGASFGFFLKGGDFNLQKFLQLFGVTAVHHNGNTLADEAVRAFLPLFLQGQQTVASGLVRIAGQQLDNGCRIFFLIRKYCFHIPKGFEDGLERKGNKGGSRGAAENNEKGGPLNKGHNRAAFKHLPAEYGAEA